MSPLKGFQKHTLQYYIAAVEKDCEQESAAILFLYCENRLKKPTLLAQNSQRMKPWWCNIIIIQVLAS